MKIKSLSIIALASLLCWSAILIPACTGCKTVDGVQQPDPAKVAGIAKVAAYVGTFEAVKQHPEWRPQFESARDSLRILETAAALDMATLLAVLDRLPVAQLKSDDAKLVITAGTIIIQEYGGQVVNLDKLAAWQPVVRAIREGIELGLQP